MERRENELERKQVLSVIERYTKALDLLDAYDHQNMSRPKGNKAIYVLTYEECMEAIQSLRFGKESDLFGRESFLRGTERMAHKERPTLEKVFQHQRSAL